VLVLVDGRGEASLTVGVSRAARSGAGGGCGRDRAGEWEGEADSGHGAVLEAERARCAPGDYGNSTTRLFGNATTEKIFFGPNPKPLPVKRKT